MTTDQTYLGDGLYASLDGLQIALTADRGSTGQRTVYLEPEVLLALTAYADRIGMQTAPGRESTGRLIRDAHHLVVNGEPAPGGNETWREWVGRAETWLRGAS